MKTLEWPSQSLDLNPIEMLWNDLKKVIHASKPSNVQRCKRLIASYRKRLIAVVAAKGGPTIITIIRFRGQSLFQTGQCLFGCCSPLIIETFI